MSLIGHAMRMRHIILSTVTCPALPYFSILSHKGTPLGGKDFTEYKNCVLIFLASLV